MRTRHTLTHRSKESQVGMGLLQQVALGKSYPWACSSLDQGFPSQYTEVARKIDFQLKTRTPARRQHIISRQYRNNWVTSRQYMLILLHRAFQEDKELILLEVQTD